MTDRITTEQLSCVAFVYVRQSTPWQVQQHRESTRRQFGRVQRAQELGWPEDCIETIDGDLGMTGAIAGTRRGFDQLCRRNSLGDVGAVFGIEVSRLSRNTLEWFQLLDLCRRSITVIVEDSHIYAPGRNDDDLVLGIICGIRHMIPKINFSNGWLQPVETGSIRSCVVRGPVTDLAGNASVPAARSCPGRTRPQRLWLKSLQWHAERLQGKWAHPLQYIAWREWLPDTERVGAGPGGVRPAATILEGGGKR